MEPANLDPAAYGPCIPARVGGRRFGARAPRSTAPPREGGRAMTRFLLTCVLAVGLGAGAVTPASLSASDSDEVQRRYTFHHVELPDGIDGTVRVGLSLTPS